MGIQMSEATRLRHEARARRFNVPSPTESEGSTDATGVDGTANHECLPRPKLKKFMSLLCHRGTVVTIRQMADGIAVECYGHSDEQHAQTVGR